MPSKSEWGVLLSKEGFGLCFFQETKRSGIDIAVVSRLWGDDFGWLAQSSNDLSGGILKVWHKSKFNFLFSFSNLGYVGCAMQVENRLVYFVNVYFGCAIRRKREFVVQIDC